MRTLLLRLCGLLFSLAVAAVVYAGLVVCFVRLQGPYTPLIHLAGLLALTSIIVTNVLWQHRLRR